MTEGPATNGAQEVEATAMVTEQANCLHCGIPIEKAKRGGTKRFCCDRHRTAYRDQQIQNAIEHVRRTMADIQEQFEQMTAALGGALAILERTRRHGRRARHFTRTNQTTRKDLTQE